MLSLNDQIFSIYLDFCYVYLPAQLLTVPLSTFDVKMVWTPNERNNRMNCNILLKNCILNDFVLCTNQKVKHYMNFIFMKSKY